MENLGTLLIKRERKKHYEERKTIELYLFKAFDGEERLYK